MNKPISRFVTAGPAIAAFALVASPALAQQRDPAYQAARTAGQVGEKIGNYKGCASINGHRTRQSHWLFTV